MFRSLITLLLFASVNASALPTTPPPVATNFSSSDLLTVDRVPRKHSGVIAPILKARAGLIMDVGTGLVLFAKNAHMQVPMASLTKIMTAVLILENHNLDEIVTVKHDFTGENLGVRIWLQQYEKIRVGDLLIGLLVPSGGDAAIALAEYHSGSVDAFVKAMNKKAQLLNLKNTHFVNPIGLDDTQHYSSAYDLAILTKYALRNKDFSRIVRISSAQIKSLNGRITHSFESTNRLLNNKFYDILGVKTGTTLNAGPSLINLARGRRGQEILTVVLNSPSRFIENEHLIDWALRNFSW